MELLLELHVLLELMELLQLLELLVLLDLPELLVLLELLDYSRSDRSCRFHVSLIELLLAALPLSVCCSCP